MTPFMLQELKRIGLLEGEELAQMFERICRDADIGPLLARRYGVRLGQDGDRLYVRRDPDLATVASSPEREGGE